MSEYTKRTGTSANPAGFQTVESLRGDFNDRLGQAVSQLTETDREVFRERIDIAKDTLRAHDDISTRNEETQRQAEELRMQQAQNKAITSAIADGKAPPPMMTNDEMAEIARGSVEQRDELVRRQLDASIRDDLNRFIEARTGMQDVLTEEFSPAEQIEELERTASYEADTNQALEPEFDEEADQEEEMV